MTSSDQRSICERAYNTVLDLENRLIICHFIAFKCQCHVHSYEYLGVKNNFLIENGVSCCVHFCFRPLVPFE